MKDRITERPNRRLITPEDGSTPYYADITRADDPIEAGTPLNKANLLSSATADIIGLPSSPDPTVNLALNMLGTKISKFSQVIYNCNGVNDNVALQTLVNDYFNIASAPRVLNVVLAGTFGVDNTHTSMVFDLTTMSFSCAITSTNSANRTCNLDFSYCVIPNIIRNESADYGVFGFGGNVRVNITGINFLLHITAQTPFITGMAIGMAGSSKMSLKDSRLVVVGSTFNNTNYMYISGVIITGTCLALFDDVRSHVIHTTSNISSVFISTGHIWVMNNVRVNVTNCVFTTGSIEGYTPSGVTVSPMMLGIGTNTNFTSKFSSYFGNIRIDKCYVISSPVSSPGVTQDSNLGNCTITNSKLTRIAQNSGAGNFTWHILGNEFADANITINTTGTTIAAATSATASAVIYFPAFGNKFSRPI